MTKNIVDLLEDRAAMVKIARDLEANEADTHSEYLRGMVEMIAYATQLEDEDPQVSVEAIEREIRDDNPYRVDDDYVGLECRVQTCSRVVYYGEEWGTWTTDDSDIYCEEHNDQNPTSDNYAQQG